MSKLHYSVKIALLAAIAFLLQLLVPFKVGGFLDIEISDYAAIIGSFALGPLAGILIELIKNIIHLSVSSTQFVGELANFIVNGAFVFAAGMIYKKNRTRKGAVIGLAVGMVTLTVFAMAANYLLLLPMYMPGAANAVKWQLIISTITPFNLAKGCVLSVLTFFTYKHLSPILHK